MRCRARRPERDGRGLRSLASPISVCLWQGQPVGPDHGREGRAGLEASSTTHPGTQQDCRLVCDMGVASSPRDARILAATPCLHPLPGQGPSQG